MDALKKMHSLKLFLDDTGFLPFCIAFLTANDSAEIENNRRIDVEALYKKYGTDFILTLRNFFKPDVSLILAYYL